MRTMYVDGFISGQRVVLGFTAPMTGDVGLNYCQGWGI